MSCIGCLLQRSQGVQKLCIKRPRAHWKCKLHLVELQWIEDLQTQTSKLQHLRCTITHSPTPGAALCCLAALGSGEEYWKFLLVPKKHKYIKPLCSTSTETFHMGEEKGENNNNKRQLIIYIGWGHSSVVISSRTKALLNESQPPEQSQGAHCCSRSKEPAANTKNSWELPKLPFAGGQSWLRHIPAGAERFLNTLMTLNTAETTGPCRWKPIQQAHAGAWVCSLSPSLRIIWICRLCKIR